MIKFEDILANITKSLLAVFALDWIYVTKFLKDTKSVINVVIKHSTVKGDTLLL